MRRFNRNLLAAAPGELAQERIPRGPFVDDGRVAEADVHARRAGDALERAVERLQAVLARLLGTGLHVGFVDLHDVSTRGKEVADFLVHRDGIVQRCRFVGFVIVVLRLLRHGERPGHGHLDRFLRVRAQELHVLHFDRVPAPDCADDARHGIGVPGAVEPGAGIVDVHARFSPSVMISRPASSWA